ncbi:MAG: alkaline phosphatase family protein [Thermodesulfobacteriota bacterium]|nr:alkaline phosphatase family protein [Thermodesulfobacteriota bacterium]
MRLLVIGIDGGTKEIIDAMNMPFLQNVLERGILLDLEEDLWSRGWAEILNGRHGRDTGAFYYKPVLGSPGDITSHFGTENHEQYGLDPLWKKINRGGHRVGFMNVPTTMPAPKVDGFFISGAGAGFNPKSGLQPLACYPNETFNHLLKIGYPWQVRFMASGIKEIEDFVKALEDSIIKRCQAFSSFCDTFSPDFGFLTHTENTPIQNVAMVEVRDMIKENGIPRTFFQEKILSFYSHLDDCIRSTVESIQPENLIVVSDHGASPRLASINLNHFLRDIDLQKKRDISISAGKKIFRKTGQFLPKYIKQGIKRSAPGAVNELYKPNINWSKTRAFSKRYIPGFYINDQKRFKGIVESDEEINDLSQLIVKAFNDSEVGHEYSLHARLYRSEYLASRFNFLLPDVWVDSDDSVFFEENGPFLEVNEDYRLIKSLYQVNRDLFTGIKGRKPLACIDRNLKNCIDPNDSSDLTQIYQIISRAMQR